MSGGGYDFTIRGQVVIDNNANAGAGGGLAAVGNAEKNVASAADVSSKQIIAAHAQTTSSYVQLGTNVAQMSTMAVSSIVGLMNAETSLANAHNSVTSAQASLIVTLRQYGQGSVQAISAAASLTSAQNNLAVAQRNLNIQWMQMFSTVIPSMITSMFSMVTMIGKITAANEIEAESWAAKTAAAAPFIALVTGGLGIIAAGASLYMMRGSFGNTNTLNQTNQFYQQGQSGIGSSLQYANSQAGFNSFGGQANP